jgi:Fe-S cluster assembly iron-binding protein IscA
VESEAGTMLELTETATDVIGEITEEPEVPETAGLRITSDTGEDGAPALAAVLTAGPGPRDEVLEFARGRVFVDPAIAGHLADRVLAAERNADGEVLAHAHRVARSLLASARLRGAWMAGSGGQFRVRA